MSVFVLDLSGKPLMPCSEKRARKLLAAARARVHRRVPFAIRVMDRHADSCAFQPLRIKLDPGSKTTGLALVRDIETADTATGEVQRGAVVLSLMELVHRGRQISEALTARRSMRRRRRGNLRYSPRCSCTIRTARSRTSGENLFCFFIAPFSQRLEPLQNPGRFSLERPDVLAHDFGGATALRAYYLDGLRYASLTIFDAVALAPWGSPLIQHVRQHESAFSGMPDYMHRALLKAYLQTAAHNPLSDESLDVYSRPWLGTIGQPAFYRQIAQMDQKFTDELQEKYRVMDCPVKVLWGENDNWISYKSGEALASLISDEPCVPIRNAGHLVQEDRPEAIVAAVLKQLANT